MYKVLIYGFREILSNLAKLYNFQGALREKNLIKIYCENTKLNINLSFFTIKFHKILPGYQKGYTDQKKKRKKD